jgi:hypothetical protein
MSKQTGRAHLLTCWPWFVGFLWHGNNDRKTMASFAGMTGGF